MYCICCPLFYCSVEHLSHVFMLLRELQSDPNHSRTSTPCPQRPCGTVCVVPFPRRRHTLVRMRLILYLIAQIFLPNKLLSHAISKLPGRKTRWRRLSWCSESRPRVGPTHVWHSPQNTAAANACHLPVHTHTHSLSVTHTHILLQSISLLHLVIFLSLCK